MNIYGVCEKLVSNVINTALVAETDIKNLYLCGQDIFNCGIAGAAFGGLLCASKTLGRNIYADLVDLKGKSAPSIPK